MNVTIWPIIESARIFAPAVGRRYDTHAFPEILMLDEITCAKHAHAQFLQFLRD